MKSSEILHITDLIFIKILNRRKKKKTILTKEINAEYK